MKKRRILSVFLSLALVAGLCAAPAGAAYSDAEGHPAQAAIARWSGYKVILGDGQGRFLPDAPLTRGAFAAIVDRIMGYRTAAENTFSDLPASAWYTPYVLRLNAAGVLEGDGGRAMPEAEVTRQEAVALLGRALGLEEHSAALTFTDKDGVPPWAAGYLSAMAVKGCFQGETAFRPAEAITRAETVALLDTLITAFVNTDGDYSADASGDVVVNAEHVTLKNMKIGGDLIIADGVGDGDVFLDNVVVAGRVILRGCGANSFHLLPGTVVTGAIIVTKTADGGIRLVNESGKALPMVNVADGKDGVTLTGEFTNVIIATDTPVGLHGATVKETVSVTAPGASVTVSGTSNVNKLDVAKTAADATVAATDSAVVKTVAVAADGLTLDNQSTNKDKTTVTVDSSVTAKPADPSGGAITPPSGGGSSGGGNPGGGTDPVPPSGGGDTPGGGSDPVPPAVTTLASVTALLPSPQADKSAVDAVPGGAGYTVSTAWTPALVDGKFAKGTVYTATLTFSLATEGYQWGASAPAVAVRNSAEYAGDAVVGAPALDTGAKTVTVAAVYPKTASEVKLVIDLQPQDLSLTEGGSSGHELSVQAHVSVNGAAAPDYLVSYQWYQSSSADMSGKTPVANAYDSSYHLPGNLAAGVYYYACGMTAEGVAEVMSGVAAVTVTAAPVQDIVLSNLRLDSSFGLQLTWDTDRPEHQKYNIGFFTGVGGTARVDSISGAWNSNGSISLQYAFKNLDPCTVTRIELTPNDDSDQPIGNTLALSCDIAVSVAPLNGVSASYDRSTRTIQFTGVSRYTTYAFELRPSSGDSLTQTIAFPVGNVCSEVLEDEYEAGLAAAAGESGTTAVLFAFNSSVSGTSYRVSVYRTGPLPIALLPSAG